MLVFCMQGAARAEAVERFKRVLLGLSDERLRVDWLNEQVRSSPERDLATILDTLIGQSEVAEPRAREALATIAGWAAGTASLVQLERLRAVALELRLLSLQRVIRRVPRPSEPVRSEPPVPDYGAGRELSLGERRNLARRSDRGGFDRLLRDPHPMVIRELLDNPKTTEDDVVRLVAHRPARPALTEAVAKTRWLWRERVRSGVLFNPGSPAGVSLPLVGLCTRAELLALARGADLPPILRITAKELAERRPPLGLEPPPRPESSRPGGVTLQ